MSWQFFDFKMKMGVLAGEILREERYPCAFCRGEGLTTGTYSKCPVCRGEGHNVARPPVVRCAFCGGWGEEKPKSRVTCLVCKGRGIVPIREPIGICHHCRGTGKEPTNKLPCIRCGGIGVITVSRGSRENLKPDLTFREGRAQHRRHRQENGRR